MNSKERLIELIDSFIAGEVDADTFCNAFCITHSQTIFPVELEAEEQTEFNQLAIMACRYSSTPEDLAIPNAYFDAEQIYKKTLEIKRRLSY